MAEETKKVDARCTRQSRWDRIKLGREGIYLQELEVRLRVKQPIQCSFVVFTAAIAGLTGKSRRHLEVPTTHFSSPAAPLHDDIECHCWTIQIKGHIGEGSWGVVVHSIMFMRRCGEWRKMLGGLKVGCCPACMASLNEQVKRSDNSQQINL